MTKTRNLSGGTIALLVLANLGAGPPATAPTMLTFNDTKGKVRLQYPDSWKSKPDKDDVLLLVPAQGNSDSDITYDVPDLPPHLPGMIRLGLIENGYIKDQKKQHPGIKVVKAVDDSRCGGGRARFVELTWEQNGKTYTDLGLLMMRKDVVYILSADAGAGELAGTRSDFDKIVASLTWTK
ncbi:MAG TPA: hypothetical protein VG326_18885 [Tepidisphaeraceae bacterium]|jgi:hypothetical protein|nr:hypothetical protein [Tepidisphaeraceae bacterium]